MNTEFNTTRMDNILDAPCVFCSYNGRGYWQKETHNKYCPFYKIGGISDRERELRGIIKVRAEFYRLMHSQGHDVEQYL